MRNRFQLSAAALSILSWRVTFVRDGGRTARHHDLRTP